MDISFKVTIRVHYVGGSVTQNSKYFQKYTSA